MTVRLRPATHADADRLLAWRNDADAVHFSASGAAVAPEEHRRWIESRLGRSSPRLWVAESGGTAVGMVRLDVDDGVGVVSIAVAPEHRGHGLSGEMLGALVDIARADGDVERMAARVSADNLASLRAFERAGFETVSRDYGWLELSRAL